MAVTLADVIRRRNLLTPREAATLTLAIGREWDRCRVTSGNIPLPPPTAIELDNNGEIRLQNSVDGSPGTPAANPLSALLGQLLGLDVDEHRGQPIPGTLLSTVAGLVPADLPSLTDEGFRAALARFADADPRTLRNVYWRVAGGRPRTPSRHSGRRSSSQWRRERRVHPQIVAELRRELRRFELAAFERQHRPKRQPVRQRDQVPRIAWWAASCALFVVAFLLLSTSAPVSDRVSSQAAAASVPAARPPDSFVAGVKSEPTRIAPAAPRHQLTVARKAVRRPAVRPADARHKSKTYPGLAGGTRGIPWLAGAS